MYWTSRILDLPFIWWWYGLWVLVTAHGTPLCGLWEEI